MKKNNRAYVSSELLVCCLFLIRTKYVSARIWASLRAESVAVTEVGLFACSQRHPPPAPENSNPNSIYLSIYISKEGYASSTNATSKG